MSEHLWPLSEAVAGALPEYTSLLDGSGRHVVLHNISGRTAHIAYPGGGDWCVMAAADLRLDLRRVDHRAWAAGEFTEVADSSTVVWCRINSNHHPDGPALARLLRRARAMDPTLTAEELLPALAWARGVTDGEKADTRPTQAPTGPSEAPARPGRSANAQEQVGPHGLGEEKADAAVNAEGEGR